MGNQQPSNLLILCRNAKVGDGYFWKHPECKNYKLVYTSTSKELLEFKKQIAPEFFPADVKLIRAERAKNCFKNAKPLYRLASIVHPIITDYKHKDAFEILKEMTLFDFGLWYLDDGSLVHRKDYTRKDGLDTKKYKSLICIGDLLEKGAREKEFLLLLQRKFATEKVGSIQKNNSKATDKNKVWYMPKHIYQQIHEVIRPFNILPHKIPS